MTFYSHLTLPVEATIIGREREIRKCMRFRPSIYQADPTGATLGLRPPAIKGAAFFAPYGSAAEALSLRTASSRGLSARTRLPARSSVVVVVLLTKRGDPYLDRNRGPSVANRAPHTDAWGTQWSRKEVGEAVDPFLNSVLRRTREEAKS